MPAITICNLGNDIVINPFPSFSVTEIAPVSATKKLAPVTPISAVVNF